MSDELEARVRELHDHLEAELQRWVENGFCGCGCGTRLPPRRHGRLRYVGNHRQRAHARRVRLEAELRGVPARASLENLQTPNSTGERQADAQAGPQAPPRRRSRRAGVSVYLPRPELVERVLWTLERDLELARSLGGAELEEGEVSELEDAVEAARKARARLERRRARA